MGFFVFFFFHGGIWRELKDLVFHQIIKLVILGSIPYFSAIVFKNSSCIALSEIG